jgi:hypothetical protein
MALFLVQHPEAPYAAMPMSYGPASRWLAYITLKQQR